MPENGILPLPLCADEEADLLLRLDTKDDLQAKTILVERNLHKVVHITRSYENMGTSIEDLVSIGTIGLIKAVNTFMQNMKMTFDEYLSECIKREISAYLNNNLYVV